MCAGGTFTQTQRPVVCLAWLKVSSLPRDEHGQTKNSKYSWVSHKRRTCVCCNHTSLDCHKITTVVGVARSLLNIMFVPSKSVNIWCNVFFLSHLQCGNNKGLFLNIGVFWCPKPERFYQFFSLVLMIKLQLSPSPTLFGKWPQQLPQNPKTTTYRRVWQMVL